ncbi:universal stress protein [Kineococcus sp. NPDC059986]|uniref:universal stress protein n=1 Tax=Kineococcus sp. NPDC059986 TaxID=3155538 RepID=UPI00344F3710
MSDGRIDDRAVVVGYDGSPDSTAALFLAAADAGTTGSALWVSVVGDDRVQSPPPRAYERIGATSAAEMLDRAQALVLSRHPTLEVHHRTARGPVAAALLAVAADARLLAVGARGAGHEFAPAWGEVTGRVTGQAACPVLVAHAGNDLLSATGRDAPRILVTLTGEALDDTVLHEGLELAQRFRGAVHVLTLPADRGRASWCRLETLHRDSHLLDCRFYDDHVEALRRAVARADLVVARVEGLEAVAGILPGARSQALLARLGRPVLAVPPSLDLRNRLVTGAR